MKSELELNIIGYIIDQDPGSILYVHPTIDDARKFSRLRVAPMIRDSKPLKAKVHDVKAKDSGNTILQKSFPGGMLNVSRLQQRLGAGIHPRPLHHRRRA